MLKKAKLSYYQRKKSHGVVRYGFYQTEAHSHPLIHLPELAGRYDAGNEEGRREDAGFIRCL
ncbi:hypothetical protein ACEQPO_26670 [Bacillus sp. SL00103]